ncbi:MAG: M3 family metallopeptidase [Bacteroidota bacterium]
MNNPLLPKFNQITDFASLEAPQIPEAVKTLLQDIESGLEKIYAIPDKDRTFANTPDALDRLYAQLDVTFGPIYLLANTSSDTEIYQNSHQAVQQIQEFYNKISLDENLYRAMKAYSKSEETKTLTGYREKFVRESVEEFERNGFALPAEKRKVLGELKNKISQLSTEFQRNIAAYEDELIVSAEDIKGLPEDYQKARRNEDGTFTIKLDYPSYRPFMKFSESEETRKTLLKKFLNRAADKNLAVLQEVLKLRQETVELLGYGTYASYQLENRMAKTPQQVWDFEKNLQEKVRPKAEADYNELLALKRQTQPDTQKVYPWESAYLSEKLLKTKYAVDSEEVKQYFELNNVISGIFEITERLYQVKFVKVDAPSVWHEEVEFFELQTLKGELLGRLYLDLFPRDQKYGHAACFPMIPRRETEAGVQVPTAALVCNFPRPTDERPSLLTHNDVETLFHEFGHGLHHLLTTSPMASFSGTSVKRDFVEVPSQHFENWTWNYESLSLFARHFETDEVLPKELFEKMIAARKVGSGLHTLGQILYGSYDLKLHDGYEPERDGTTTEVYQKLQNELSLFDPVEDTYFEAAFGHLMGYAAGYYGYLWAKVFSEDVFAAFAEEGVLSPKVGGRYLREILSLGGTVEEADQLRNFLGREPEPEAFLRSIGV